jgi:hypothetical protein
MNADLDSVADPDPNPDPHGFGPPGSTSQWYGSGSRSFYHAKIVRKTFVTIFDFLSCKYSFKKYFSKQKKLC